MRICNNIVHISVRDIIEFILKYGSLDASNVISPSRAALGTKAHKKIQKSMGDNYTSEVVLKHTCTYDDISFVIEGRADGVIENIDLTIIDEIKSTMVSLDIIEEGYNPLHLAQVKCYAFMYASDNQLTKIGAQLTYYNLDTKETKRFLKIYDLNELETFFKDITDRYASWIRFYVSWCTLRDSSLKSLVFPFEKYRTGQRELAIHVYKSILSASKLLVNAPTGIGKTISTLFPTLKAMGESQASKVFYITAKTITRTVAENAITLLHSQGVRVKCITLTAKDKVCFCETTQCTPSNCRFAEGHFDRVNEAVWDAINSTDLFTRDVIETYANKHRVCPFELSLDIALWVDIVVCDYNYIFDPTVALKRFLDASEYVLLIDEAHNLVDRGRDMFSANLSKRNLLTAKKLLPKSMSLIRTALTKINSYFLDIKKDYLEQNIPFIKKEAPQELYSLLRKFINACDKQFQRPTSGGNDTTLLELYFSAYNFLKILEFYDEKYITYAENSNGDVHLKLFCLDPSYLLGETMRKFKSTILFSATLLPIDYYKYLLNGEDDIAIRLESPFDKSKAVKLAASDVSTRYQNRDKSYPQICHYIKQVVDSHKGNHFVFFPSYKYLIDVHNYFKEMYGDTYRIHVQSSNMSEIEKEEFLNHFEESPKNTHIGFCVLGGIFSEGIDLKYDRLIGVIIVGVGLPQLCLERSLIENYFNELGKNGYHYAYTYPGINKVFQAAGRLIRTEEDKGIILLIDDRFCTTLYRELFPIDWFPHQPVTLNSISYYLKT